MTINLQKGHKISLEKTDGGSLTKVALGLGWDAVKSKGFLGFGGTSPEIDLDASCLMFAGKQMVDAIWFRQLKSKDGSITHTGDNRTGDGDGDDETINVNLEAVPSNVDALVFTVSSFTGQTFQEVENAYCRLVDMNSGVEIARFNLTAQGNHTGQIMSKIYRHNGAWKMQAIGENVKGRTFSDMMPGIAAYL